MARHADSTGTRRWIVRTGEDFGRAISEIRTSQRLTQADLAAESALTRAYVAQIESGRTTRLLDHVMRMLRRMGATVTITWTDHGSP